MDTPRRHEVYDRSYPMWPTRQKCSGGSVVGLLLVLAGSPLADATGPARPGLDSAPPALPVRINSHVTAAAWAAKAAGVALPAEEDRTLAATAQVHVQGCNTCGDSTHWDLANGLTSFLAGRGAPAKVTHRWRTCADEATRATLDDVARVLVARGQAIATFCYGRAAVMPAMSARTPPVASVAPHHGRGGREDAPASIRARRRGCS